MTLRFQSSGSRFLGRFLPLALIGLGAAEDPVSFNRDIRPILSDRCFHCHGPDSHERKGDLRLDLPEAADGPYRTHDGSTAITPGSLETSEVWKRLATADPELVMPPPDSHKPALDDSQKDLIKRWILQGAEYQDFWAFVPPFKPEIPEPDHADWSQRAIDRFVMRRLEEEGREPNERADRRTLIRRLSLDLTGLPPGRAEIAAFLDDESPDAYEKLVDRLIASPRFGEHLGRYWLDLVRFADTNGLHHDHFRDMSPYRDWVIQSFNENLPYDQFVRDQLAGDLYPEPTTDQLVASGFHRLHLIIDRGTKLPEESHVDNVIDRVTAVGTAFMGLTVQCAACHDHKYDPVTMKDFYSLYAFFNNIDAEPETGRRAGTDFERGLQPPYITLTNSEEERRLETLKRAETETAARVNQLKQQLESAPEDRREALKNALGSAQTEHREAAKARARFENSLPAAMVMKEREEIRPAHLLIRGAYDNPGEVVERATPEFLPPLKPASEEVATRMDLANWFVRGDHPLTARVAVNRFWQQLFGTGIVKTSEDLGAQGEWPSHPDLLNYLAASFVENGWDVKALFREMVLSETYRQRSEADPREFADDPDNRLLARGSRYRLDAEVIRDQILATSGLLVDEMYGKSVKPPQPDGLWKAVTLPDSYPRTYQADSGDAIHRRSVYTFWKRGFAPPQMTILDAPARDECIARRERTNTPLQALLLMNERQYIKAARKLAAEVLAEAPENRLDAAYETLTARLPDPAETEKLRDALDGFRTYYREHPDLAAQLAEGESAPDGVDHDELAAWTMLTSTIYNLDLTKSRP
jgi:hypothetical protein